MLRFIHYKITEFTQACNEFSFRKFCQNMQANALCGDAKIYELKWYLFGRWFILVENLIYEKKLIYDSIWSLEKSKKETHPSHIALSFFVISFMAANDFIIGKLAMLFATSYDVFVILGKKMRICVLINFATRSLFSSTFFICWRMDSKTNWWKRNKKSTKSL